MTIFDILKNERVIVWSSEEDQLLITWNQDKVLQSWVYKEARCSDETSMWFYQDIKTFPKAINNFNEARELAKNWCAGVI